MRTILLTGCAGYLGHGCLESLLLPPDVWVVGLDNLTYGGVFTFRHPRFTFKRCDIRDKNALSILFDSYRFDTVIHTAALVGDGACQVNQEATKQINDDATNTIANLCNKWKSRLIYTSTCSVYGVNHNLLDEESPVNPLSLYAITKLAGEEHVKKVERHTIHRLGTVHGYNFGKSGRFRNDLVANLLTIKAFKGQKLSVFGGTQLRPMVYAGDVADTLVNSIKLEKNGTFILSHQNYTIKEIAETVVDVIPSELEITDMKFEDLRNYQVSNIKALKAGFENPTTLKDSIKEMIRTFKEGRLADVWQDTHHNEKWLRTNGQTVLNSN